MCVRERERVNLLHLVELRAVIAEVSGRVVQLKSSPLEIIGLYDLFAV